MIQIAQGPEEESAVEVVKTIDINANEPLKKETANKNQNNRMIQLLADKWSIDEEIIELQIEGGDKEQ